MDGTWKYPEVTQSQKNTHGMYSLISGYYPKSSEYPRFNSQTTWSSRRRKTKVWILRYFLEGGTKYRDKVWSRDWRKGHPETAPPGDPSHIQTPNPDTIVDAKKCLLTGAWYSCLLRGSASAWQVQKWMLSAIHWMEHKAPNEGARERSWRGLQLHRRNNNMN